MVRKQGTEKRRHWQRLLNQHAKSGLTIQEFCSRESISQPSFYAWRKKLREQESVGTAGPKSRRRVDSSGSDREFIPLQLGNSTSALEVIHPHGYQIRISGAVDIQVLQQVLQVLDGRVGG